LAATEVGLAEELRAQVAARLARWREAAERQGRPPSRQDEQQHAAYLIEQLLAEDARHRIERGELPLEQADERVLTETVQAELFRLGRLQPLLDDSEIENIDINGCDQVWLHYADGTLKQGPAVASSDAALVELIQLIAERKGPNPRPFTRSQPRLHLKLPDGSRLFATMGVSHRPVVSIRRHRLVRVTLGDLVRLRAIDQGLHAFLAALVRARKNVLVAGGTNVGKTTLLRALINEIPPTERLVTIENAYELGLHEPELADLHPNVVALEARDANIEGEGQVAMADLVRDGLRLNPSRVIVGEVLGDEVLTMLEAMSQGNPGSMCTIHAESSQGAFQRVAMYAAKSAQRLDMETTYQMLAGAVHFVVFIAQRDERHQPGGSLRRFVASVREVTGVDGKRVITNEVYQPGPDGRAVPRPGAPLRCLEELELAGFDREWLQQPTGWWLP
jgi:Flp pilus assembly CpaF family ATPase